MDVSLLNLLVVGLVKWSIVLVATAAFEYGETNRNFTL
jgi:hypothetical protein